MSSSPARADQLLLQFDGFNIVRRVYGAVPGEDSPQKVEGVLKSSTGSFMRAIKEFKPTHVLAAFDFGGHTFRHDIYPQYKAMREAAPPCLTAAMPAFIEKLISLGIPTVSAPNVEAEDVIATVGAKWLAAGRGPAVAMSTDKDLAQMGPKGLQVRDQFMERWLDNEWCMKKFGVPLELLGDCLSLMSDTVDGVPGVPSVGPKTAAAWLLQYGSLESVLSHREELKGAKAAALCKHYEDVLISRKLVELKTDVPLNLSWNQLRYTPPPAAAKKSPSANPAGVDAANVGAAAHTTSSGQPGSTLPVQESFDLGEAA